MTTPGDLKGATTTETASQPGTRNEADTDLP